MTGVMVVWPKIFDHHHSQNLKITMTKDVYSINEPIVVRMVPVKKRLEM